MTGKVCVSKVRKDGVFQRYWKNPIILTAPKKGWIQVTKVSDEVVKGGS